MNSNENPGKSIVLVPYLKAEAILRKRFSDITPEEFLMWLIADSWTFDDAWPSLETRFLAYRKDGSPVNCSRSLEILQIKNRRIGKPMPSIPEILMEWFYHEEELKVIDRPRWITFEQLTERWKRHGLSGDKMIAVIKSQGTYIRYNPLSDEHNAADIANIRESMYLLPEIERIEREQFPAPEQEEQQLAEAVTDFSCPTVGEQRSLIKMNEPKKKHDWFYAFRDCVRAFEDEYGYTPNTKELWARLTTNPPPGYGITWDSKKESLLMAGSKPIDKEAFRKQYDRRYPPNSDK
jgi:hypothetical protein